MLTGDFLFARAAELAAETDSVRVMSVFARTLMVIVNGEINQMFVGRGQASREGYLERIYAKTASLFAAAAEAGAILGDADDRATDAMRLFGSEMGMAFQIVDDVLDFTADQDRLGKPVGSDLMQGTLTLPSLLAMESPAGKAAVTRLFSARRNKAQLLQQAIEAILENDTIARSQTFAEGYAQRAIEAIERLPDTPEHRTLVELTHSVLSRDS